MCIIVSCSARAISAWWPAAGLVHARLPRSCRAQAHSGGADPGAPAQGQVDVDGHVQQRQAVPAGAASKRPGESGVRQGALRRGRLILYGTHRGVHLGSLRFGRGCGTLRGAGLGRSGDGKWAGVGRRGGALASPDRVVLRSYPLRAVLGLAGEGKARGVSGLNGESPTLRGLLGTHVRGALSGSGGQAARGPPGAPSPRQPRGPSLTCRRPRPVPGRK